MSFIEDLAQEMNKVRLYDIEESDGTIKRTIECDVVCSIIMVLLDKYGIGVSDDLHG